MLKCVTGAIGVLGDFMSASFGHVEAKHVGEFVVGSSNIRYTHLRTSMANSKAI